MYPKSPRGRFKVMVNEELVANVDKYSTIKSRISGDSEKVEDLTSSFEKQLTINIDKEKGKGQKTLTPGNIEAQLVGATAEVVSRESGGEMVTVFNKLRGRVKVIQSEEIPGLELEKGKKGEVLYNALLTGTKDSVLDVETADLYAKGMGFYVDKKNKSLWSYQNETVIPDGWCVKKKESSSDTDELCGFMDVKCYKNEELKQIVEGGALEERGVNRERFFKAIDGMVRMYVLMQRQLRDVPTSEGDLDVVLRFPKDADPELLRRLGDLLTNEVWGDEGWQLNLAIQTLPLTRDEVLRMGKELVGEGIEVIEKKEKLSKRNKKELRKYLGIEENEKKEGKIEIVHKKEEEKSVEQRKEALQGAIDAWRRGDKEEFFKYKALLNQSGG